MYLYLLKELGFSLAVNWQIGKAAVGISIKYVKFLMLIFLTFTCVVWFLYIGSETFHVLDTCAIKLLCCTKCSTKYHQPCSGTVQVYLPQSQTFLGRQNWLTSFGITFETHIFCHVLCFMFTWYHCKLRPFCSLCLIQTHISVWNHF